MERVADYNGWTNWETWNTALMIGNDEWSYNEARSIVDRYDWDPGKGEWALRDWAIESIIGPTNKQAIEDAQGWNDIPMHERLDPHYEDLKERNPQAADLVNQLGFGPDVSDYTPQTIDPELVNWEEIYESFASELREERGEEEVEYEDPDAPGDSTFPDTWLSRTANDWGGWVPAQAQPDYYTKRRPWWYDPETGKAFIGEQGSYHPKDLTWGWVKGEYWPENGDLRTTNMDMSPESQQLTRAAEDAVRRQLFPPSMQEDETPTEKAMREYQERMRQDGHLSKDRKRRTADADSWSAPAMTTVNEGVSMPTQDAWVEDWSQGDPRSTLSYRPWIKYEGGLLIGEPNEFHEDLILRTKRMGSPRILAQGYLDNGNPVVYPGGEGLSEDDKSLLLKMAAWEGAPALYGDPDTSNNWLYLNGKVATGDTYWGLAQRLAEEAGMGEDEVRFITNQIARNHLPPDWDVAYGEFNERGQPRIWGSTIDRNHVWDIVNEHSRV